VKTFLSMASAVVGLIQALQKRYGGSQKAGIFAMLFVFILFELTLISFWLFFGNKSDTEFKEHINSLSFLEQKNSLENAKDRLQICIDSPENDSVLKTRYCKSAVDTYQEIFRGKSALNTTTQAYFQEKINISAYSEMINDVRFELRRLEYSKLRDTPTSIFRTLFTWSLKSSVISVLIAICFLVMLSIYFYFSKKPKQKKTKVNWPRLSKSRTLSPKMPRSRVR
jgi:hypothetical protein